MWTAFLAALAIKLVCDDGRTVDISPPEPNDLCVMTTTTVTPTTTPPTTLLAQLVGFIPSAGPAADVAVDPVTNRAYVASQAFGVSVLSIGTASPTLTAQGGTRPPFTGSRIAQSGSFVLAVDQTASLLRVVDVSNPSFPRAVGSLPGSWRGIGVHGTKGYGVKVIPGNPATFQFVSIDLANPGSPQITGTAALPSAGNPGDLRLDTAKGLAYVAGVGVHIVRVSTQTPSLLATAAPGFSVFGVALSSDGNRLYVATGSSLRIVDVSDAANPVERGNLGVSGIGVAVDGTTVYLTDALNLHVVNAANPSAPVETGRVPAFSAARLATRGTTVLLASADSSVRKGLVSYQCATLPCAVIDNDWGESQNDGVAIAGKLAVVANNNASGLPPQGGLRIIDATSDALPVLKAYLSDSGRGMKGVAVSGSTAYSIETIAGNPSRTELVVVDFANPSQPQIKGRASIAGGSTLKVTGTAVLIPAGAAGLQAVDVSTPSAPVAKPPVDTPGAAVGIDASGTMAYVADQTALLAFDVSDPLNPVQRGSVSTTASAVAVSGAWAYVLDGLNLRAINIANPGSMQVGPAVSGRNATTLTVLGNQIYAATRSTGHQTIEGVQIFSATNPPVFQKQIVLPGNAASITAGNGLLYVGDSWGVLDVVSP